MTVCYRVRYRNKKGYWSFFSWFLSVTCVNGQRLKMQFTGEKEPYHDFLRQVVITMKSTHIQKKIRNVPSLCEGCYDGVNYWITAADGNKRKNCWKCTENAKNDSKAAFICMWKIRCGSTFSMLQGKITLIFFISAALLSLKSK